MSRYWKGRLLEYFILGVPVYRLRYRVPYHRSTLERFFRNLRNVIYQNIILQQKDALSGSIELDEALFGGYRKGPRGWVSRGKHMVFGIYKRNGHVITHIVKDRGHDTLHKLINVNTKPGSLYFSDEWHAYTYLSIRGKHVVVKKEKGRPRGRDHINGIEGFWSYAKNWLYQYRGVPKNYFPLYLKEVEWRFNNRNKDLVVLLRELINQRFVKERI
jgi:transposase